MTKIKGLRFRVYIEHVDGYHYIGTYTTLARAKAKGDEYVGKHGSWYGPGYGIDDNGGVVTIERNDYENVGSDLQGMEPYWVGSENRDQVNCYN